MLSLFLTSSDDYRDLSWEDAVAYSTGSETTADATGIVSVMMQIDAGVEGLAAWSGRQLLHDSNVDLAQVLATAMTMAFVLLLWFLLAWAYGRALVGTMARVMEIWRPRPPRPEGRDMFESWWL